jgi:hypothetical protein
MGSHVEVNDSARSMFHDHQHVEYSKGGTRYDEEVAGDDGRRVILEKGLPTVIARAVAAGRARRLGQIFPDGARRHAQAEFHEQLVSNSLLAPGWDSRARSYGADGPSAMGCCEWRHRGLVSRESIVR